MGNSLPTRFILLDVMRALAVVMMIQGHTIDALLRSDLLGKGSFAFDLWQVGRGLTAPIFLFGSGFAYVFATIRKSQGGRMGPKLLMKRIQWIAVLFLVGSLMHFPASSFLGVATASAAQWDLFYRIDVLRLMAIALMGLLMTLTLARTRLMILRSSLSIAAFIVFLSPLMQSVDWTLYLPRIVAAFLSTHTGSIFPVFPFAAYVFTGAAAASFYLQLQEKGSERSFILIASFLGLAFVVAPLVFKALVGGAVLSTTSPGLFSLRLGLVLLLWACVGFLLRKITSVPAVLPIVGQHTLLIYVSHIVVLYGSPWFIGLNYFYGQSMNFVPVFLVIVSLLIGAIAMSLVMHTLRHRRFHVYQLVPYASLALLVLAMTVM